MPVGLAGTAAGLTTPRPLAGPPRAAARQAAKPTALRLAPPRPRLLRAQPVAVTDRVLMSRSMHLEAEASPKRPMSDAAMGAGAGEQSPPAAGGKAAAPPASLPNDTALTESALNRALAPILDAVQKQAPILVALQKQGDEHGGALEALPKQGNEHGGALEALQKQGDEHGGALKKHGGALEALQKQGDEHGGALKKHGAALEALQKQGASTAQLVGRLAEVRKGGKQQLFTSARKLVKRVCSWRTFRADYAALIDTLLKDGSGFRALLKLVHERLQKEFPDVSLLAPGEQQPWPDQLAALKKMQKDLQRQRGGKKGKTWRLPYLVLLEAYAEQAAAGGAAGLRRFLLGDEEQAGRLALTLLVALSGGQLRNELELDQTAQLRKEAGGLGLDLCKIKASGRAAKAAKEQLALAARVLVFAVHAANAPLLASRGPLAVRGTISVFDEGSKALPHDGFEVDVGCPSEGKKSALPATKGGH
ncbi:hypothetical protein ABPG75_001124 [Micractinium tetrahymenae]